MFGAGDEGFPPVRKRHEGDGEEEGAGVVVIAGEFADGLAPVEQLGIKPVLAIDDLVTPGR